MAQFPNFVQIKPINALLYTLVLCTAPHPLLSLLYFIWLPTYIKYLLGKCLKLHVMTRIS